MSKLKNKIDMFFGEEIKNLERLIEDPQHEKIYQKNVNTYKTFEFLHNELERLKKIKTFFIHKLSNQLEYSQIDSITQQQNNELDNVKNELLGKICLENSIINKQLERIFDKAFG